MIIPYIHGDSLSEVDLDNLDPTLRANLYAQLADIFIQLRYCEFPHIGSLTLDPVDVRRALLAGCLCYMQCFLVGAVACRVIK